MRGVKKRGLSEKFCPVCGRPFRWPREWRDDWGSVLNWSRRRRSAAQGPG